MFARSALRAARPLKQQARRCYASTPGAISGGDSNTLVYSVLGAGALGGGYFYYTNYGPGKAASITPKSAAEPRVPSAVASASAPTRASASGKAFTGGDQGFIDLKLESVEEINHNTKKFRFALPNSDDVSGLQIASALLTKYKGAEMEKPVIRPYTPTSDEDQKGYLDLVIKRYPGGAMSEHMHNMKPDQRLEFKGPIPKYRLTENQHDHIALIAGGTGITPMYQLARSIFKNPSDKTNVTLIFGNLTEEDILLKHEFQDLENTYPQRFRAFYMLDKPPEGWTQGKGHVSTELLKTVLPEPGSGKDLKIFVCGPPGFYKAVSGGKGEGGKQGELQGMLKELGYKEEQVYKF